MAHTEITTQFKDRVRAERTKRKWTQAQLAQEMADRGIPASWSTVNKTEVGSRNVTIEEAAVIADVFGLTVDRLIGRRARPQADRDYALRQLHESVEDTRRSIRVGLRDIADRTAELAEIDRAGVFTGLIEQIQKAGDNLSDDMALLAQCAGAVAETRGNRAVWRAVRITEKEGL
jgi:transcriptional regulator with XRE-family HTH domain